MIKKTFPFLAISVFSTMLGLGIIAPLLPLYADSLGATGLWIGVIFGGFSVSRAVFTPLFGRLSDSRGRKNFLGTGLFIYSVLSLGYIFSGSVFELFGVRLIHGAVSGMIIPIARAWE